MNKTSQGVVFIGFSSVIFVLAGYVINIFLGRYLGPVYYGDYGVVISLMSIINLIQLSGIPQAVSKYISEDENKSNEILASGLNLQLFTGLLIGLIYFFLSSPIAYFLKDNTLIPFLQESAIIYPFYAIYSLYIGLANGRHQFQKQALMNAIYSLGKLLFVFILVFKFHLYGAIAGFILAPIIGAIPGFYFPKKTKTQFPYKKLIYFSLPLIGFAFFSTLLQNVDIYLIKALLPGKENVGFYTASQNISRISIFGLSAFSIVLFPSISRSVSQKNIEKTRQLIKDALRYILMLILPLTLLISATSKQIIEILYSVKYLPAATSLSILCIGFGFATLFSVIANILNGGGYPKISLNITILGMLLTVFFSYLLIPNFGTLGAAWAMTIGNLFALILGSFYVYRYFKALISLESLLKILIPSILIYLIVKIINPSLLYLIVIYPLTLAFYIAFLIILKEINQKDMELIYSLIPRMFNRK